MTKINTKNLICCRVELETIKAIEQAIKSLELVENNEFYYNYELSKTSGELKNKLKEVLSEVYNEITN
jgi:hypothetical protein